MTRTFRLKAFLRYINAELLQVFLKSEGVDGALPKSSKEQEEANVWADFIYKLEDPKPAQIETALQDVNEMATDGGTLNMVEVAAEHGIDIKQDTKVIENEYCRALYCYTHHRNVFENAFVFQRVNELKGKTERTGLKKRTAKEVIARKDALAKELKMYFFSKELRGQNCEVDAYNDHDKRVCFIAYPEDHHKTDLFYEKGLLKRMGRRPTFQVIFLYECTTGRLEISVRTGWKKKVELMSIFNKQVLEDDRPVADKQKVYNLAKLLDKDFEFATKPEDQIEYVNLQELSLTHKYNKDRLTIIFKDPDGVEYMREALKDYKISPDQFNVVQAKIQIKFPQAGRQKGSVTFHLSWPDRCDLGDSLYHLKAKEYVKHWNLEEKPIIVKSTRSADADAPAEAVSQ